MHEILISGTIARRNDRVSFLLSLHRYGVAMIDLDAAELESDVENA